MINNFNKSILPGVGSYKDAILMIKNIGWDNAIKTFSLIKKGVIWYMCGMQILSSFGYENGKSDGLDIV